MSYLGKAALEPRKEIWVGEKRLGIRVGWWAYLDCPGDTYRADAENHFIPGEVWVQNIKFTNNYILTERMGRPGPVPNAVHYLMESS